MPAWPSPGSTRRGGGRRHPGPPPRLPTPPVPSRCRPRWSHLVIELRPDLPIASGGRHPAGATLWRPVQGGPEVAEMTWTGRTPPIRKCRPPSCRATTVELVFEEHSAVRARRDVGHEACDQYDTRSKSKRPWNSGPACRLWGPNGRWDDPCDNTPSSPLHPRGRTRNPYCLVGSSRERVLTFSIGDPGRRTDPSNVRSPALT